MDLKNQEIFEGVKKELERMFPIDSKNGSKMELVEIKTPDAIPSETKDYISAVNNKDSMSYPLEATVLFNGKKSTLKLCDMPAILPATNETVIDGNAYSGNTVFKTRLGVYFRETSEDVQCQFNVSGSRNFKIIFDMATKMFSVKVFTKNFMLYPILRHLNITDEAMEKAWGKEVYKINMDKGGSRIATEYDKFIDELQMEFDEEKGENKENALSKMKLDPKSTKIIMGQEISKVDPHLLLNTSKKCLNVYTEKEEIPSKDLLVFKTVSSTPEFIRSRVRKMIPEIRMKLRRNMDNEGMTTPSQIVPESDITKAVKSFYIASRSSDLGPRPNPMYIDSEASKITAVGEGTIDDSSLLTLDAKSLQDDSLGFIDPVHTPEGNAGVVLHTTHGTEKKGDLLEQTFINVKTGKKEKINNYDTFFKKITFPNYYDENAHKIIGKDVPVVYMGKRMTVPAADVDYTIEADRMFSNITNLTPFLHSTQGNRALMSANQFEQVLSLKNKELPLLHTKFTKIVGDHFLIKAEEDGVVKSVSDKEIVIGSKHYELPESSKLGLNSAILYESNVKVGQSVKKGDILAGTNFHKDGELATGLNTNIAVMPFKGYNIEDGIVISQGYADKSTSIHTDSYDLEISPEIKLDKKKYRAMFPMNMTTENYAKLDDDGVIKKGEFVRKGDTVIAAIREKNATEEDVMLSRLGKSLGAQLKDCASIYNKDALGEVISVTKQPGYVRLVVKYEKATVIGDKFTGRAGNKGIITAIVPDLEMPRLKNGTIIDMVLNPTGVPSRINPGQLKETALGKEGIRREIRNFKDYMLEDAKKIGSKETIYDPEYGEIDDVPVGNMYMQKLVHVVDKKYSTRSADGYTSDMTPTKGGGKGGQSLDQGALYGLLAHGAENYLQEAVTTKSEKNLDSWRAIINGELPPKPKETFVFGKMLAIMNAMGINTDRVGSTINYFPATDEQINDRITQVVKSPTMLKAKDLQPDKDGLFDYNLGGTKGEVWGKVNLKVPVINPLLKDNVALLLGKKTSELKDMSNSDIFDKLKNINIDKEIENAQVESEVRTGINSKDKVNKKLKLLYGLKKAGVGADAYMLKTVPILPPIYRPISVNPATGAVLAHDFNELYKNVIELNNTLEQKETSLTKRDDNRMQEKIDELYMGLDKDNGKNLKGLVSYLKGPTPKEGFYQSKVVKKRQDFSGRSTITPDPKLGAREIGIPKAVAYGMYKPFLIREFKNQGYSLDEAEKHINDKTQVAEDILKNVAEKRPVLYNRAPSLHRFSIMAAMPKLHNGKDLRINPLYLKNFNADFDGDTMSLHVPISEQASDDITKMLVSKNVFNDAYQNKIMPSLMNEQISGIYAATKAVDTTKEPVKFANLDMLISIYEHTPGRYRPDQPVIISSENNGKVTSFGRCVINFNFPRQFRVYDKPITGSALKGIINTYASSIDPEEFTEKLNNLKAASNYFATKYPISLGVEDLHNMKKEKMDAIDKLKNKHGMTFEDLARETLDINKTIMEKIRGKGSNFLTISDIGAKGNELQTKQVLGLPGFVTNMKGQVSENAIVSSYGEGLNPDEYWNTVPGVRYGSISRSETTALPGYLSKMLINNAMDEIITEDDCHTSKGESFSIDDVECMHRLLVEAAGGYPIGTVIKPEVIGELKKKNITHVKCRTPETCEAREGICSKCWGVDNYGHFSSIGTQVGIKVAQAIAEPLTQGSMNAFHTGGLASKEVLEAPKDVGIPKGFDRIKQTFGLSEQRKGVGAMAMIDGSVSDIRKNSLGEYVITVKSSTGKTEEYTAPFKRTPVVKVGDLVKKGDLLTDGLKNMQHLFEVLPLGEFRQELKKDIRASFGKAIDVSDRSVGLITRAMTNLAEVTHPGKNVGMVKGDTMQLDEAMNIIKSGERKVQSTYLVVGEKLARDYKDVSPALVTGKVITKEDIDLLKKYGKGLIFIKADSGLKIKPKLKGVTMLAHEKYQDIFERMNYNRIPDALSDAASFGTYSSSDTMHAIPRMVMGDMGKAKK